jgi:hypothetical protein
MLFLDNLEPCEFKGKARNRARWFSPIIQVSVGDTGFLRYRLKTCIKANSSAWPLDDYMRKAVNAPEKCLLESLNAPVKYDADFAASQTHSHRLETSFMTPATDHADGMASGVPISMIHVH